MDKGVFYSKKGFGEFHWISHRMSPKTAKKKTKKKNNNHDNRVTMICYYTIKKQQQIFVSKGRFICHKS